MRVVWYHAALFSWLAGGISALIISTPLFLTAGPARINFTREAGDPVGAFFNIGQASNASRIADDVDIKAGFVDVNILVLPGTYFIFAFSNDSDTRSLGNSDDFPVIAAPSTPSTASSSASSTSKSTSSPTISGNASNTSVAADQGTSSSTKKSVPVGMVVGIVVGVVVILAILLFLCIFLRQRRQQKTVFFPDTIQTAGPPVHSWASPVTDSPLGPEGQIDPFVTPISSNTSLSSPAQRQEYLTNEMRLVRKRMEELRRSQNLSASTLSPSSPQPSTHYTTESATTADLERSRQENDALQNRIVELEAQLQSAWAQGLSNEPPPGYVA
ncbi:hypothetical protein R3P38DRAFT_2923801 [Favolaschia claudopus]|uniref:Mid2 domain-containing protein n=1 Tax=Favolaschia claudopus TaxID=2862362 RepID=A0AAW0BWT1_9AGAR